MTATGPSNARHALPSRGVDRSAALGVLLALALLFFGTPGLLPSAHAAPTTVSSTRAAPRASSEVFANSLGPRAASVPNATDNLTAALGRAVLLVGLAAGALVTLVWSRVAVSWFSHDPSRKVQAKERARDAAIGSLVLIAAVSGLAWGLARFVLTGS